MCAKASMDEFEALLKESFEIDTPEEGTVVKGKVIAIEAGQAIIDVGYKMEGRIDLKEFANPGEAPATHPRAACRRWSGDARPGGVPPGPDPGPEACHASSRLR